MGKSVLARILPLVEHDVSVARLLAQIAYWHPKMKITKAGQKWIAKTREEWMRETGLTRHQYDRALRRLKERRLIYTARFKFLGQPITHLCLTEDGVGCLGPAAPHMSGAPDKPPSATADSPITVNTGKEYRQKTGGAVAPQPSDPVLSLINGGKAALAPIATAPRPSGLDDWQGAWLAAHALAFPGEYARPFTQKQRGQLKLLCHCFPAGMDRAAALARLVTDWQGFTQFAKDHMGAFNLPMRPDMGFATKYAQAAVNFVAQQQPPAIPRPRSTLPRPASAVAAAIPTPPAPVPAPVPVPVPAPGGHGPEPKASLDDVLAIFGEIE